MEAIKHRTELGGGTAGARGAEVVHGQRRERGGGDSAAGRGGEGGHGYAACRASWEPNRKCARVVMRSCLGNRCQHAVRLCGPQAACSCAGSGAGWATSASAAGCNA